MVPEPDLVLQGVSTKEFNSVQGSQQNEYQILWSVQSTGAYSVDALLTSVDPPVAVLNFEFTEMDVFGAEPSAVDSYARGVGISGGSASATAVSDLLYTPSTPPLHSLYTPSTPPLRPLYTPSTPPLHPLHTPSTPPLHPLYAPSTPPLHHLHTPSTPPLHPLYTP